MTQKLEDLLNIDHDEQEHKEIVVVDTKNAIDAVKDVDAAILELTDVATHGQEMDQLSNLALDNHEEMMEAGRNSDPKDAARLFEIAATMQKIALDALNNKAKARLKAAELLTKKKVVDRDDEIKDADVLEGDYTSGKSVLTGDRNEVLKKLNTGEIK